MLNAAWIYAYWGYTRPKFECDVVEKWAQSVVIYALELNDGIQEVMHMQNDRSYDWVCQMRNWDKCRARHVIKEFQTTCRLNWNVECNMNRGRTWPRMKTFKMMCRCRTLNEREIRLDTVEERCMLVENEVELDLGREMLYAEWGWGQAHPMKILRCRLHVNVEYETKLEAGLNMEWKR